ncbi:hypothetical protein MY04_0597 [Flammeovirga sp. MY04]|uniref:hypothetical protein n=1 Tax=Flammeovirga sp. MY04 TaxID=1191459 RepID=UPI000806307C|nr:hypothetical protein [Flammeovirga sp. MY04]ANQ47979.1 hypothetical protein MY04_0597 [Flammeovirga sp. MY04]
MKKLILILTVFLLGSSSLFAQKLLLDKEYTYKMDYKAFKKLYRKEEDRDKKNFIIYNGKKVYKKNMGDVYIAYKCKFDSQKRLVGFDLQFIGRSKEAVREASVSYMQELVQAHGYKAVTAGSNKLNYQKDSFWYKQGTLGYDYIDKRNKSWVAKYTMSVYSQAQ